MALVKRDLVDTLVAEHSMGFREATDFIDMFFEELRTTIEERGAAKILKLGTFTYRDKQGRINPRFRPAPLLRQAIATYHPGEDLPVIPE